MSISTVLKSIEAKRKFFATGPLALLLFLLIVGCSRKQTVAKDAQVNTQKIAMSETRWKVRNQVTDFMIKFFKYGLLTDLATSTVSLSQVGKYKELFYENAKLYNDLENKKELISTHKYFAILIDYMIDKKYEIYYKETVTSNFINNELNGILQKLSAEPDGSYKIKIPIEKWCNHTYNATTNKLEKNSLPVKNQLKITLYANPESDETTILTIEN